MLGAHPSHNQWREKRAAQIDVRRMTFVGHRTPHSRPTPCFHRVRPRAHVTSRSSVSQRTMVPDEGLTRIRRLASSDDGPDARATSQPADASQARATDNRNGVDQCRATSGEKQKAAPLNNILPNSHAAQRDERQEQRMRRRFALGWPCLLKPWRPIGTSCPIRTVRQSGSTVCDHWLHGE